MTLVGYYFVVVVILYIANMLNMGRIEKQRAKRWEELKEAFLAPNGKEITLTDEDGRLKSVWVKKQ